MKGGALQACTSFILEALKADDEIEWSFALSTQAYEQLTAFQADLTELGIEIFTHSPAHDKVARRRLKGLEEKYAPNAIFTFFGPAYVRFEAPHICGVADGWVTHSTSTAFRSLGLSSKIIEYLLLILYKGFWFRRADAWIVEANSAKNGLVRRWHIPPDRIYIVPNNCGLHYVNSNQICHFPNGERIRILCLSAYYLHKNMEIIPDVAGEMIRRKSDLPFEFVLTLPFDCPGLLKIMNKARTLGVEKHIVNLGPVPLMKGPETYRACHISFLPSLLETFSANYPEAMAMKRPLVTTDLDFARDACGPAAVYFRPTDPRSAAGAILSLIDDRDLWLKVLREGDRVLASLPTSQKKYVLYRECIERVASAS